MKKNLNSTSVVPGSQANASKTILWIKSTGLLKEYNKNICIKMGKSLQRNNFPIKPNSENSIIFHLFWFWDNIVLITKLSIWLKNPLALIISSSNLTKQKNNTELLNLILLSDLFYLQIKYSSFVTTKIIGN